MQLPRIWKIVRREGMFLMQQHTRRKFPDGQRNNFGEDMTIKWTYYETQVHFLKKYIVIITII